MQTNEYLDEVYKVIRENFAPNDPTGGMTVAAVGYLVRRFLGADHTQFGFLKFKDVLQRLEQRGVLRTGVNSKNAFSIWLLEQPSHLVPANTPPSSQGFRPLRKTVWLAFVAKTPAGRRFLNRATGDVKLDAESILETDLSWVEIIPLNADSDRKRAFDFLKENGVDNAEILAILNSERWYVDLPKALMAHSPVLATDWKRCRSHHVIGIVRDWCQKNKIDERLVFDDFSPRQSYSAGKATVSEHHQLKTYLLAVLERMSADELMKLKLPVRHLVAVLRPDLLD